MTHPGRPLLWAFVGSLAAVLLACDREGQHALAAPAVEEKVAPVRTRVVIPREVRDIAYLAADVRPLRRAVLAAEAQGTVEKVTVDEGAEVAAGQLLLEIDTRSLRQRVAEAEAVHRRREILFERAEKLLSKRSITAQQHLDAVTERDIAEVQLASARLALEKSRLAAPWAGAVARRRVEVGDYVVPGQPVIELLDVRRVKVRAPAPAADIQYLRPGLEAEVRVDGLAGEVFQGNLTRLAAELDPAARTLDVEVEIPNPRGQLRPGMAARLEIPRRTLEAALLAPLGAVVELEGAQVLYIVENDRAVRRTVELGTVVGDEVVIASGLGAGERLVIEGQQQISPGQRVVEGEL